MTTRRLTNDDRDSIRTGLIAHTFRERLTALREAEDALLKAVYEGAFSAAERKRYAAAPAGDYRSVTVIGAVYADSSSRYTRLGNYYGVLSRYMPKRDKDPSYLIPARLSSSREPTVIAPGYLRETIETHVEAKKALETEITGAVNKTAGLLLNFRTAEKLIEAWPEIAPFVPAAQAPVKLPALNRADLNAEFGLPVS